MMEEKVRELLEKAAQLLRDTIGAFESNNAIDWGEFAETANGLEAEAALAESGAGQMQRHFAGLGAVADIVFGQPATAKEKEVPMQPNECKNGCHYKPRSPYSYYTNCTDGSRCALETEAGA